MAITVLRSYDKVGRPARERSPRSRTLAQGHYAGGLRAERRPNGEKWHRLRHRTALAGSRKPAPGSHPNPRSHGADLNPSLTRSDPANGRRHGLADLK